MNLGTENETLEFKESTSEKHEALETIAAIINKHRAGTLYFGVMDNGEVTGQIVSDSTIKDIADSIYMNIEPRIVPAIEKIEYDNKQVLRVTFSGTQVPYSAFGKFLIRVGTQNRKMSRDELIKLVKKSDYSSDWERETYYTVEDIDEETLKLFYAESTDCGRLTLEKYDKVSMLSALGLIQNEKLLNAAYALFGKSAPLSLKLACFPTEEKITFIDLKEIKGNIYNLINEAMTYISKNINWRVEIGKRQRIEIPEVPLRALREMVINSFAHANYEHYPEIEINIHPNKIVIFNPGSFPDDLTPNDFVQKNISSIKRNPIILSVLFRCKNVEQSGTGFKRMNQLCQESHVGWTFQNTAYGFYFEFIRSNVQADPKNVQADDQNVQADPKNVLADGQNVLADFKNVQADFENVQADSKNVQADVSPELNFTEKIVYLKIKENCTIKKIDLAIAIDRKEKTVQRIFLSLIKKGYIKRIGNNQHGYWEVLK